jgi:hypothetical protein
MMLGDQAGNNDRTAYNAIRAQLGLDRPLPIQYLSVALPVGILSALRPGSAGPARRPGALLKVLYVESATRAALTMWPASMPA